MNTRRPLFWISLCLLCLAGAWFFWPRQIGRAVLPHRQALGPRSNTVHSAAAASKILTPVYANSAQPGTVLASTNPFAFRLSNTAKSLDQLAHDRHAILLENALIDVSQPLNFSIPAHLQSQGDPGAYIVQARGPIDAAFRAMLAQAGAEIVSYIPNNAYLVRAAAGVAEGLAGNPLTQAVTPYEPYYKIQLSLLTLAIGQMDLPDNTGLTLGLFTATAPQTIKQIEALGWTILSRQDTTVGTIVQVQPQSSYNTGWPALATLPGTKNVELSHTRVHANDLSRMVTGVAVDTRTTNNYLNLSGQNVTVAVDDSGIDATHPDLAGRVSGDPVNLLVNTLADTNGHGTHVAGIIAGNGLESTTVTNVRGSIVPGTNGQFRGMAPLANLLAMSLYDSDQDLQEAAARTNALISNNSWNYDGDNTYDLAAASYDAAVRDALPGTTGSQPVLFVFAAGNYGDGDDTSDPGSGFADTIQSPATAKNVVTVGAIQEFRNITNQVITISANNVTNTGTPWQPETSTSYRIASFSSRGNVGIGTEGTYGRYKPDVVAPGTFVVSTRSAQWDIANYFYINPTNQTVNIISNIIMQPDAFLARVFPLLPKNTVGTAIYLFPNPDSPDPFPGLPIYFGLVGSVAYPYSTTNNQVIIPSDGGLTIASILGSQKFYGFNYGISNNTTEPIDFNLETDIVTTNNPGNYFLVLSNLNQAIGTPNPVSTGPGPYYRYETGTSMAAADVSGVLALMQDYFTNTLHATPSPALLKAMLVNGARVTSEYYNFQVQNALNYEGWGLINLPDSVPPGITTNTSNGNGEAMLILDQSPATALATGDSHTYHVTVTGAAANLQLRITLAWTDPPGDPAAAIKLVNDLNLVVTNLSNSTNPIVYYGNDIPASSIYNSEHSTTNTPVYDFINNVENVYLPAGAGTNFSVTVLGYRVNVNAVTAQTNNALGVYAPNVVQDYALVISSGEGEVTNAFTVTDNPIVSNPTADQQITFVTQTNTPLLDQFVGASTPLLGTNQIQLTTNEETELNNIQLDPTNLPFVTNFITLGMTNQWHFYVITNTGASDYTNAAFITFIPDTLSVPRMGVFADSQASATRPEADIDLYVSTNPGLTNLDPVVISNADKSLGRGGTEFVYYTNSVSVGKNPGAPSVYYVGVYSEDQEASEYGFIPIFTDIPFSQSGPNGSQIVNGLVLPVNIPDGSTAHPGIGYIFALAMNPMEINRVVVTNIITHQDFGDLIGTLQHGTQNGLSKSMVLNNHDSLGNPPGPYNQIYDDSKRGDIAGSRQSDGPGSLNNFMGQQALGPWTLTEVDDAHTQTGSVLGLTLYIEPHQDLTKGIQTTLGPLGWYYTYIDVPAGATNLTFFATNITASGVVDFFVRLGAEPTLTTYDEWVQLKSRGPLGLGGTISIGPPLTPGRYFIGLYNESTASQTVDVWAYLGVGAAPGQVIFSSSGPAPILDDAVMTNSIFVTADQSLPSDNPVEVALRVDHPRVSDLVFHLISPDGTRVLLVENRGGATTNGMGATYAITNMTPVTASGGATPPTTNVVNVGQSSGTLQVQYDFFNLPDEMVVYDQGGAQIFDSGMVNSSGVFNIPYSNSLSLTIVMNPFGNSGGFGDLWDYTVSADQAYYGYLVLTEDTNKTTTPIKFAPVPFQGGATINSNNVWHSSFEGGPAGDSFYTFTAGVPGTIVPEGWHVDAGGVKVLTDGGAYDGAHYLDLDGTNSESGPGTISTNLATSPGQSYILSFAYSPNPFAASHFPDGLVSGVQVLRSNSLLMTLQVTNRIGTPTWATTSIVFTANSTNTKLVFQSLDGGQGPGVKSTSTTNGVLLDAINLAALSATNGDLYYQPEQSLDTLAGENAYGEWQLEVWDNRAGAGLTNTLQSWQLRFNFPTASSSVGIITNGLPQTNTIPAGGIAYYLINVPTNADIATNILISSGGPLILWFNPAAPPSGTNSPGDILLLGGTTNGTAILYTNGVPPLVPGGSYYLGVQNTNTAPVTNYVVLVDFHLTTPILNGGQPSTNSIPTNSIVYYVVQVPTNADWATNQLIFASGPLNLWFNSANPPVGTNPPDILVFGGATSGTAVFGINTMPTNIVPGGTYYLAVQNTNNVPIDYVIEVDFHLNWPSVTASNVVYIPVYVPANADAATNQLVFATGPLNLWFTTNAPPSITNATDVLMLPNATNGTFVLNAGSTPPLAPGTTYWIGVQNPGPSSVSFDFEVNFHLAISGLTITHTNLGGTNGFLLQWQGPTNYEYEIQWTTNLAPLVWSTVLNPVINVTVTATNGHFSWFDDGTLSGGLGPVKFYRVLGSLGLGLLTGTGPVTNTVLAGAMSPATVIVPANALWASNVLLSATGPLNVWFNQTNPPAGNTNQGDILMLSRSTNGVFVLTGGSVPPLVPGADYYLGFQNPGASNVTFVFDVTFGLPVTNAPNPVSNFSITATNGGIWLKWTGLTNYVYQVQWITSLTPPEAWNTVPNLLLSSTNGIFTFFDDGSLTGGFGPGKFYRLIAWPLPPATQTLSFSSVTLTNLGGTNDLVFRWSAPTNYQYAIQWTTNLALPFGSWQLIASPVLTLSGGVYTFVDNGQTGPPAGTKFFRLFEY